MVKNKSKPIVKKNKFINSGFEKKSRDGSFLIFGRKPITEQLKDYSNTIKKIYHIDNSQETPEVKKILDIAKAKKVNIENINSKTAISILGKVNHQGISAQVSKFSYQDQMDWEIKIRKSKKKNLVLVLDKMEDVGNFGAIIRTAAAVGVSAIFVSGDNQAPVNGTVFKTSAGNILKVKIIKVVNIGQMIQKLKDLKFWTYAIDMAKGSHKSNLWGQKFDTNTAFILGGEGKGISLKVREKCDFIIPIPMENNVESLNISVSAAIAMYEWKRQETSIK